MTDGEYRKVKKWDSKRMAVVETLVRTDDLPPPPTPPDAPVPTAKVDEPKPKKGKKAKKALAKLTKGKKKSD